MQISKKSPYDFAIIGAGISGASAAYFLNKFGKKVIVVEKNKIASGGSGAAGAFLSPKICSDSLYSAFINEAFKFSIKFYKDNFPEFLEQKGILRLLKNENEILKCKQCEKNLPKNFKYLRQNQISFVKENEAKYGGYFFEDGAIVDSKGVIAKMLKDIKVVEGLHVEHLNFIDNSYAIGDIRAKGVVLCVGNSKEFEQLEFCLLKNIYGHRIDIKTSITLPFHIHKSCSISASKDKMVHIGATHIPNYKYDESKSYEDTIKEMITLAKSYVDFDDFEVDKIHFGARNSTLDFFPVAGKAIKAKETLEKYPYIVRGSFVPKEKYEYYTNMFILSGVGARGFVLAPKIAEILARNICNNIPISKRLDTQRLFIKFSKKQYI